MKEERGRRFGELLVDIGGVQLLLGRLDGRQQLAQGALRQEAEHDDGGRQLSKIIQPNNAPTTPPAAATPAAAATAAVMRCAYVGVYVCDAAGMGLAVGVTTQERSMR